ncbi:phosphatase PAP2 family protein [Sneathiella sp.]|jgi:membrane-associated phospholipid phosphatase|uniref:phosphatase PAP2 family protein n=1 Tax=Sneathiella sp. TaxID=1964365 RepID=UPI0039E35B9D
MFQTNINLFLQSFSAPWLDSFMQAVSWTGDQTFIVGLLCLVALGIDLKRGFILVQIFLITIISTDILKTVFSLPRPFFLDERLNDFGGLNGLTALRDVGTLSFFEMLPDTIINAYRSVASHSDQFGLPSGHTSSAIALWGGLAIVFRKNRFGVIAVVMVTLMMISRMYLAQHFLADVLAGLGLGLLILLISALLLNRLDWWRLFSTESFNFSISGSSWVLFVAGFVLPIGLLFSGEGHVGRIASFLALNLALFVLIWTGCPLESGRLWHRVFRTLLGFALFFAISSGLKYLPISQDSVQYTVLKGFAPVFILFVLAPFVTAMWMVKSR